MTVIVGVEDENGVTIGADSLASRSGFGHRREDGKLFTIDDGSMIIGTAGSCRLKDIIRYHLNRPSHPDELSDMEYLVCQFISELRDELNDEGNMSEYDNVEHAEGKFLIGYQGKLFEVHSDFQVSRLQDSHTAIGSGFKVAHGALYANDYDDVGRKNRVQEALEASAYYTNSVGKPFIIKGQEK
jgi:ATP-dependent protease HslVU (ClpYQ) peptidase subunit